jgi:23S rRNA (guanosine2251-2'-O)-methyltransferase
MMARKLPPRGKGTRFGAGTGRPSGRSQPPAGRSAGQGPKSPRRTESKRQGPKREARASLVPTRQGAGSQSPRSQEPKRPAAKGRPAERGADRSTWSGARVRTPPRAIAGTKAAPPADLSRRSPAARRVRPPAAPATRGLWLYGRHAVEAALKNPRRSCHRLLATAEALARLGAAARRSGLELVTVEREELDCRFGTDAVHQGLALSVAPLPAADLERACAPEPGRNLVLVLDQITDPHNLGAILRSAAAFEARAVVVQERNSAELGGATAKAAAGAADVVPVIEVTNLARALDEFAGLGYWRVALDGEAEAAIDQVPDAENLVLVLGAEGSGLRRLVREHCDFAARLPIAPAMESLNVSVACGIALYALGRRPKAE